MNSVLRGRQADLFQLGSKRSSVAEVAKTLESVLAILLISWRDRLPDVADLTGLWNAFRQHIQSLREIGYQM